MHARLAVCNGGDRPYNKEGSAWTVVGYLDIADESANKTAQSSIPPLSPFPELDEIKIILRKEIHNLWEKTWQLVKGGYLLGQIIPKIQQKAKCINSTRKMEVIFAQCRIGKCKLNAPLYEIKQAESPKCDHCEEETVQHPIV